MGATHSTFKACDSLQTDRRVVIQGHACKVLQAIGCCMAQRLNTCVLLYVQHATLARPVGYSNVVRQQPSAVRCTCASPPTISQPTPQPTNQPASQPISLPTRQPANKPGWRCTWHTRQTSSLPASQPASQPTNQPPSQAGDAHGKGTKQPASRPASQPASHPASLQTQPALPVFRSVGTASLFFHTSGQQPSHKPQRQHQSTADMPLQHPQQTQH
jgi:hypothetical protein